MYMHAPIDFFGNTHQCVTNSLDHLLITEILSDDKELRVTVKTFLLFIFLDIFLWLLLTAGKSVMNNMYQYIMDMVSWGK